jgi:hypothetical protein
MSRYAKVDENRNMAKKAAAYDQLVAESQQAQAAQQGAMKGLQFGEERGYAAGMADNDATSEQAYIAGANDAMTQMTGPGTGGGGELISDREGVPFTGYSPRDEQDLQQYAVQIGELVKAGRIDVEQGRSMVQIAQQKLMEKMQGQGGGAEQGLGNINTNLTQQAADLSMQQ